MYVPQQHTTQSITHKYTLSEALLTPSNIHACTHTHAHTYTHTCTHTNTVGQWGEVQIRGCPEPHEWATHLGCLDGTSSGFQPTCDPKCRWWQGWWKAPAIGWSRGPNPGEAAMDFLTVHPKSTPQNCVCLRHL